MPGTFRVPFSVSYCHYPGVSLWLSAESRTPGPGTELLPPGAFVPATSPHTEVSHSCQTSVIRATGPTTHPPQISNYLSCFEFKWDISSKPGFINGGVFSVIDFLTHSSLSLQEALFPSIKPHAKC